MFFSLFPNESLPKDHVSFQTHLLKLRADSSREAHPQPHPVTYVQPNFPLLKPHEPARQTHVMAILNVTPDSFSDGGRHFDQDFEKMRDTIRQLIEAGASIIDVGGQSTRPNATFISAMEEIKRVVPVVKLIRSLPEANNICISVDTFHARVAKATIDAGADIINDISGGGMDPEMFATVAASGKTMVISHTRGDPQTMTSLTDYPRGVVAGVAEELLERVNTALNAGIRPWRIILDPGIGFAKTQEQNLEILRDFTRLRDSDGLRDYPWLIGTSRKKFIGTITEVEEAGDRVFGTAATVVACIREGADIIRVHDVEEMCQVAKMADAIYRVKEQPPPPRHVIHQQSHHPSTTENVPITSRTNTEESKARANHHNPKSESKTTGGLEDSYPEVEKHPFYHLLLGSDAIATDGLNTSGRKR